MSELDRFNLTLCERLEDHWWRWHDADSSRWSPGEDPHEATAEAEARCKAWVSGDSNDGPSGQLLRGDWDHA